MTPTRRGATGRLGMARRSLLLRRQRGRRLQTESPILRESSRLTGTPPTGVGLRGAPAEGLDDVAMTLDPPGDPLARGPVRVLEDGPARGHVHGIVEEEEHVGGLGL